MYAGADFRSQSPLPGRNSALAIHHTNSAIHSGFLLAAGTSPIRCLALEVKHSEQIFKRFFTFDEPWRDAPLNGPGDAEAILDLL